MIKAAIVILLAACGSSPPPPPPPPAKPASTTPPPAAEPAAASPLRRELTDLSDQNAAHILAIRELAASVQQLDDSEDAIGSRRAELQKLNAQRDALTTKVTATRTRAQAIADKREEATELLKSAEEERDRATRSLRELEDLKARLTGIEQSFLRAPPPAAPADDPKKKKPKGK